MLFEPDSDFVTGPQVREAPLEPVLDVDDIQGVVLPGFGTSRQHLLGLRFADADATRRWLGRWGSTVSSLRQVNAGRNRRRRALRQDQPRPRTPLWTGLALSAEALRTLTLPPEDLGDAAFSVGLAARSGLLGDPPAGEEGHRLTWLVGGTAETTPHILIILGAEEQSSLDERVAALSADADGTVVYSQAGELLEGNREHFGFMDGVSQVGIRGRLSAVPRHFLTRRWIDPADPLARLAARPGQPLVWPGQFLFGLASQRGDDPLTPGPPKPAPEWARNGSLLAFRRLRQDVPAFRRFTEQEAARLRALPGFADLDQAHLEAALVGRWPDGSALSRTPGAPEPAEVKDMLAANYFGYATDTSTVRVCADPKVAAEGLAGAEPGAELRDVAGVPGDPAGQRCPTFSHIRKVNPRDLATDQDPHPEATLTFQMLRRGITWGKPYAEGEAAADADRGLLFMSWQTSLEDQFERLSARWMNNRRGPDGNAGHDVLVGQAPVRECVLSGADGSTAQVRVAVRWVLPTGGGYFFGPSLSTLRALGGG
jgi:Dyp-type peroxidase family